MSSNVFFMCFFFQFVCCVSLSVVLGPISGHRLLYLQAVHRVSAVPGLLLCIKQLTVFLQQKRVECSVTDGAPLSMTGRGGLLLAVLGQRTVQITLTSVKLFSDWQDINRTLLMHNAATFHHHIFGVIGSESQSVAIKAVCQKRCAEIRNSAWGEKLKIMFISTS